MLRIGVRPGRCMDECTAHAPLRTALKHSPLRTRCVPYGKLKLLAFAAEHSDFVMRLLRSRIARGSDRLFHHHKGALCYCLFCFSRFVILSQKISEVKNIAVFVLRFLNEEIADTALSTPLYKLHALRIGIT